MSIRRILPIGTHLRKCIICGYPITAKSRELTAHELECLGIEEEKKDDDQRPTDVKRFSLQAQSAGLTVECAMGGIVGATTIAIIAEAPGRNEVAQGFPLVGGAGNILWNAIRTHAPEVKRHECYVTNVVKRQVRFGVRRYWQPQTCW